MQPGLFVGQRFQLIGIPAVHVTHHVQPVVHDAVSLRLRGRLHTAAPVVTAHEHVFHIQKLHRVLECREHAEIIRVRLICDVAMGEDFARL